MLKSLKSMLLALKNKFSAVGASQKACVTLLVSLAGFLSPMQAQAQSAACAANESLQSYSFASPNNWTAGAATINYTVGTGAASVGVSGAATLNDIVANSPTTAQSGGFADAYYYLIDRTSTAGTNTVVITFSKPINKLQIVATDLDTAGDAGGSYQDQVSITGTAPGGGVVNPTAVASDGTRVAIAGTVATATGTFANCTAAENLCNATYSFAAPIVSFTMVYGNGPSATGNPPNQVVGLAALGFCVQNPDLTLLKDDGSVSFAAGGTGTYTFTVSNVGSAATSGTRTVKDILPAGMSFTAPLIAGGTNDGLYACAVSTTINANDTATCTTTTAIAAGATNVFTLPVTVALAVASGTTLTNKAKVFGGNDPNKAAETTTGTIAACPSDSLAGAVANAGCGFEATPIIRAANVVITKTDGKTITTSGTVNNYVVTLTNQGPSVANGVIVTDVIGVGLNCPGTNVVTCSGAVNGAVCPGGALTVANLTGAGITVATLPVNGALQFAYTCTVL